MDKHAERAKEIIENDLGESLDPTKIDCGRLALAIESHLRAVEDETLERCAAACDQIEEKYYARYKGLTKERPTANPHDEGMSDGAGECAAAIRALKEQSHG